MTAWKGGDLMGPRTKLDTKTMLVYLAGPIAAGDSDFARYTREWRYEAKRLLETPDEFSPIYAVDPVRGKQNISPDGLKSDYPGVLLTLRDEYSVRRADIILLNTLQMEKLTRQSIGTWSEFGCAAMALKIPTVVMADQRTIKEHPFIETYSAYTTDNLEDAIAKIRWMRMDIL